MKVENQENECLSACNAGWSSKIYSEFPGGCHSEEKEPTRSCSVQLHSKSMCFACHLTFADLSI